MANDPLTVSTGCRDGESLCRVTLPGQGDLARARELVVEGGMEPQYRAGCLGTIARYLAERGARDDALTLFAEAVRVANTIGNDVGYPIDPSYKASVLSGIVREMAAARQFPEALRLTAVIVHAEEKIRALVSVAKAFATAGLYDRAIAVAEGIERPVERVRALALVARAHVVPPPRPAKIPPRSVRVPLPPSGNN